jgi:hypothetical protein
LLLATVSASREPNQTHHRRDIADWLCRKSSYIKIKMSPEYRYAQSQPLCYSTKEQVLSNLNRVIDTLRTELCTGIVDNIAGG